METLGLPPLQQNIQQPAPPPKNLKTWFDDFRARVSKKSQLSQSTVGEAVTDLAANDDDPLSVIKESPSPQNTLSNLRSRNLSRTSLKSSSISAASEIAEFDHETSNDRHVFVRARQKSLLSKVMAPLRWIIYYTIPFNYNLPWKLLSLINSSFVIIVIGLASGSTESSEAFSFTNGFLCGLTTACMSFIILTLSFMVYILPKSHDTTSTVQLSPRRATLATKEVVDEVSLAGIDASLDCTELREEDFCLLEELCPIDLRRISRGSYDEDYRGWMIEFIGDYELRNSSDIKLRSIYVKIESRILYLCKTKGSHEAESNSVPTFTSQRVYDLSNVEKFSANLLIPKNVRNKQKYVWSKKYPIRLEFQTNERIESGEGNNVKQVQLTLLAKSCREKEEWFRKFKRIVEVQRLGIGPSANRKSLKSEISLAEDSLGESILSSFKRFRCRSPSPKRDCVQTSQSSHFLSEQKKTSDDEDKCSESKDDLRTSSLARTKSCELLHPNRCQTSSSESCSEHDTAEKESEFQGQVDDSTLTKETADLFSQNIDYTNFLESQPSLDYKEFIERLVKSGKGASPRSDWFNALTGRIFFDVFSHDYWSIWFKRKIQRKLYRIRLPYFMETLTLTQIDLGTNAPQFFNVESYSFDSLGLSIDFAMAYTGGLTMTFETKLNLLKIKSDCAATSSSNLNLTVPGSSSTSQQQSSQPDESSLHSDISNILSSDNVKVRDTKKQMLSSSASARTSCESTTSDSEDSDSNSSSGSSFDEAELNEISDWEDYGAEKTRQNIVKFVDKIASSKYFQHATENRYIKKKLQDISNCPLVLVVKIQSLNGVLTLNVPPPQTDRIWYGFKPTPELELKAIPKMGDREVSLSHVTDWIERKLSEEFRKILVIPNMEDILLPVLRSDHMQYITPTR